ncbi:uncharacterized protein [Diadema antillarum]|uniref:uncharacterized protein n=1 Tax=Diadema antillarum TaxID=105358 RepID=UPI003A8710E3
MVASLESIIDSLLQGQVESSMGDIHHILTNPEEVSGLQEFTNLIQEAARQEQVQRSHARDVVAAYASMKDDIQTTIAEDKSGDAIGEEISALQDQHQKALQDTEATNQQCEALKVKRDAVASKQNELSSMRETVKEDTTQVLPKTRYNVSLYSCITGVKWDYDCKPDEVKGYVSTSKDVRPFSLDSKQHSRFFITNYLWDLVAAASEAN